MSETMTKLFGDNAPSGAEATLPTPEAAPIPSPEIEATPAPQPEIAPVAIYGEQVQPAAVQPVPVAPAAIDMAPVAALVDERMKRREAQQESAALREQLRALKEPPKALDIFADPDGYAASQRQEMAQALWQQKVDTSRLIASQAHGADEVKKAEEWFIELERRNPAMRQAVSQQAHPIEFAVQEYRKNQILDGLDWSRPADEIAAAILAKHGKTLTAAPQPAPLPAPRAAVPPQPALPPRSIASETSVSGPKTAYERSANLNRILGSP